MYSDWSSGVGHLKLAGSSRGLGQRYLNYLHNEHFTSKQKSTKRKTSLKEPRHGILSHFIDGLNYGKGVAKPKKNGTPRKRNTIGVIQEQKGTRMAEDGKD